MNFEIIATPHFRRELKKLAKRYTSIRLDFQKLIESLEKNPKQGIDLGRNCYKIRISIASKGKGKSGGARVITNIVIRQETVYLLSIYDKSDKENITKKELQKLLEQIDE
ncbi:MAG: type II toxin-antitoxin system RelE/ParE family toxin [Bacteroidota bacterium]